MSPAAEKALIKRVEKLERRVVRLHALIKDVARPAPTKEPR